MADDPRDVYQHSIRKYEEAREKASEAINMVKAVGSALNYHFESFAGFHCNVPMRTSSFDRSVQFDLNRLPTGAGLKSVVTAWYQALCALQEAWDSIPADQRLGFAAPPKKLEPK